MPNTLAHIGVQGLLTRAVARKADFKWICLGCIIPDLPWILQRAVWFLGTDLVNVYDLRLYSVVQSSLFLSLVLCASAALFSSSPRRVFSLLALNSAGHLILDALETKWANGVLLFAPFSWQLLNLGLFWPESVVIFAATAFGLGYFVYAWRVKPGQSIALSMGLRARTAIGLALLAVFLLLPLLFVADSEKANNHYVAVLRDSGQRAGKYVEMDRTYFFRRDGNVILRAFTGEEFLLLGQVDSASGTISVRGRFFDESTVETHDLHEHSAGFRDGASMVGLFLVGVLWLVQVRRTPQGTDA
jgi:hypothetical protein